MTRGSVKGGSLTRDGVCGPSGVGVSQGPGLSLFPCISLFQCLLLPQTSSPSTEDKLQGLRHGSSSSFVSSRYSTLLPLIEKRKSSVHASKTYFSPPRSGSWESVGGRSGSVTNDGQGFV